MHSRRIFVIAILVFSALAVGCARAPIPASSSESSDSVGDAATATPIPAAQPTPPPPPTPLGGPRSKVLRVNLTNRPDLLDPQRASASPEIAVLQLAYEGLTRIDDKGRIVPAAADRWEFSSDRKTLTFHLRDGLKRADGTLLTAKDFEFALKHVLDPRVGAPFPSLLDDVRGATASYTMDPKARNEEIERSLANVGIKASDDQTLVVTFDQPTGYWPALASTWLTFPSDKAKAEKEPDVWWLRPENHNGNGPFKLSQIEDQVIKLIPNPNYWGGRPKLDRIEFYWVAEAATVETYRQNDLDVIRVTPENFALVQADPKLNGELFRAPSDRVTYLGLNVKRAPFADKTVRKAFSQALDREGFVRDVLKGLGKPHLSWIPPGVPGYDATAVVPDFDAKQAVQTLIDAGYATADKKRIDCAKLGTLKLTYPNNPRTQVVFQFIAGSLTRVFACPVLLDPVEPDAYSVVVRDPRTMPQVYLISWEQEYAHPQNWLFLQTCTGVFAARLGYCNRDFDAALTAASQEADADRAVEKYKAAQKLFVNDLSAAFLWNNDNAFLVKPYVLGMTEHAGSADRVMPGQSGSALLYDIDLSRVGPAYPAQ